MITIDAINVCQQLRGQQLQVSGWLYASRNVQNVTARRGAVLKDMAVSQSHGLGKSHLGRLLMPTLLIGFQQLFNDVDQWFVWRFSQYITLLRIWNRMYQGNFVFTTKVNHLFRLESICVIYNQFVMIAKMWQNIIFKKLNYYQVSGLPSGNRLNPFFKIICRC